MTLPAFAAALHAFRKRQAADVLKRLRSLGWQAGPPGLDSWLLSMVEGFQPHVVPYFLRGGRAALKRIDKRVRRRKKKFGFPAITLDLLNPRVAEAIRQLTFDFCLETLQTSSFQLTQAFALLRDEIYQGLAEGEAIKKLSARVQKIFADPQRAYVIARTEASRATHAGQLLAAEESGVVKGLRWLATAQACPLCQELDGKEIPLGGDFAYEPDRGAYSHVRHPPRHPHCTCSTVEVLKDEWT